MTTDSLIALLPKNACYMASSNGVAVVLKRTPEGEIQATAVSVARDSTSARLEVVHAAESEQYEEIAQNNVTTEETHLAREPTGAPWKALLIPALTAMGFVLAGFAFRRLG